MIGTLLNNRYRIDAKLGEGGMGVVYKAHDTMLDRLVAIKALSPHLLGAEGLKRLQREAQSAAKLTHPNIVGIYDVIDEGDSRLIVMEYVAGRTLRELIPQPWTDAVEIARQVCLALDYAHSQGIVHRDIKPENIIATPDGTAKVMDFGLARSEGRSRLTQTGMLVGTVAYMAPEQALQGVADARSDLYSLGCVLYELVAGHPPFEAEDPIATITQHINIPPVAPRFHTPGIPDILERVILKLLAKDPGARYRSARDVALALETLHESTIQATARPQIAGPELVQAVRRGILVGRDKELKVLKALLDDATTGEGRLALIAGQAGTGKTRLVEELITYAHLRGGRVLSARCYEGGTPYETVGRMLREYLRASPTEEARLAFGDYAADLARLVPEVKQKLGTLAESIPLPPEEERFRLFESVTQVFRNLCKPTPILMFVDDLHLADTATLQFLRHFAPTVARERVLFVTAYRVEETDRNPRFAELLTQVRRERHAVVVDVKPLTQDEVGELIQAMSKRPTTPVLLATRIFEVTEGNPYFIEEVINAFFEQGTLYIKEGQWSTDFDDGARYAEMPVPATVRTTIETRLQRLSEDCRQVLTHAAVLGRQFRLDALTLVTGKSEEEVVDLLDQALGARLLREVQVGGEDRYEFSQAMVREAIYEAFSRHRRRRMHLRVAEVLEQVYGARRSERAGELAGHLLEAGEKERAVPYLVAAGEQAEALFAHEEALKFYGEAADLLKEAGREEEAAETLWRMAEPIWFSTGDRDRALAPLHQAMSFYQRGGNRLRAAEAERKMGFIVFNAGDPAGAIPHLERALRASEEIGPPQDVAGTLVHLARARLGASDPAGAEQDALRARDLAVANGLQFEEAMASAEVAFSLRMRGAWDEAIPLFKRAIDLAASIDTMESRAVQRRCYRSLGSTASSRGDAKRAIELGEQSLRISTEERNYPQMALDRLVLAYRYLSLGDWSRARKLAQENLEPTSHAPPNNVRWSTSLLRDLDGDWEGARQMAEEDLADALRREHVGDAMDARSILLSYAVNMEEYEDAVSTAREQWEAIRRFQSFPGFWPGGVGVNIVLTLTKHMDEARDVVGWIERNAEMIDSDVLRAQAKLLRALMAGILDDWSEALKEFEQSLAASARTIGTFAPASRRWIFGRFLLAQDDPELKEEGRRRLREALDAFERMGATRYAQEIRKRLGPTQGNT